MNKFDKIYDIRQANYEDIESIMQFIDEHWRKGHIMAVDRTLFEYEYVNNGEVNFILAINRESHNIEGIFGYLPCSQTTDKAKKDIWGSMWKVIESAMPFLGIELAKRAVMITGCRMHIGNGANPKTTVPLRKLFFKEKVDKMQHYYFLNYDKEEYRIASVTTEKMDKPAKIKQNKLIRFLNIIELKEKFVIENEEALPYKDNWYFNKRYFEHPYYTYEVYGIENGENGIGAILVCREIVKNGSKALRIMDYLGEESLFGGLYETFKSLLKNRDLEYIDFYVYGLENKYITNAGFILRDEQDTNIIPNYFEPFLQSNVDIWVHYKLPNTKFFKADGDQDRPNKIRE